MDITDWITSIASLLTSLFTLGVLFQVRELQIQNKNEAINQLYTRMFEIQNLLISQNCYKDFFRNDKTKYYKFKIYAQMYADFLEQIMIQKKQLTNCGEKDIWGKYVNDILEKNIHVKKYIQENEDLYHINLTQKCK